MDELLQAIANLRNQVNAMLTGLPPLEQFEAASDMAYGIRSLTTYGNSLVEMANNLTTKMTAYAEKAKSDALVTAEATVKEKLIADGVVVLKVDSEASVQTAISQAQTDTRALIVAEMAAREKITQRRAALVTDKKLPQVAAEKISDAVLGADDHEAQIARVVARVDKLQKLGLTAEKAGTVFAEMAGLPTDEGGESEFTRRYTAIEATAAAFRGTAPAVNPLAGAGGGGNADPEPARAMSYF